MFVRVLDCNRAGVLEIGVDIYDSSVTIRSIRPPFQGGAQYARLPRAKAGLKPWAILFNHSMVLKNYWLTGERYG